MRSDKFMYIKSLIQWLAHYRYSVKVYTFIIIIRFVGSKSFISLEHHAFLTAMFFYNNKPDNGSIHFTGRAKASIIWRLFHLVFYSFLFPSMWKQFSPGSEPKIMNSMMSELGCSTTKHCSDNDMNCRTNCAPSV